MASESYLEGLYSVYYDSTAEKQRLDAGKKVWVKDRRAKGGGYWRNIAVRGVIGGGALVATGAAILHARKKKKERQASQESHDRNMKAGAESFNAARKGLQKAQEAHESLDKAKQSVERMKKMNVEELDKYMTE